MADQVSQQLAALQVGCLEPTGDGRMTSPGPSSDLQITHRHIYITHRKVKMRQLKPVTTAHCAVPCTTLSSKALAI